MVKNVIVHIGTFRLRDVSRLVANVHYYKQVAVTQARNPQWSLKLVSQSVN